MTEKFVKLGKNTDEVDEVVDYLVNENLHRAEVRQIYDNWADTFDEDVLRTDYQAPLIMANEVDSIYGNKMDIRILDVGAGTGLVGKQLYKKGFKNLDALEPSPKMLDRVRKRGCYQQLYEEYMGNHRLNIPDECYDVVVSIGAFIPGHLNEDCYEELIRVTKKGGHIFILMKERYFTDTPEYSKNLEPRMLELQKQGLWKRIVKKTNIQRYHGPKNGVLFVLQKC